MRYFLYNYVKDSYHKFVLRKCTDNIKQFSMDGVHCYGVLVNVYDGDTFRACVYHNGIVKKLTFRPTGYDTPEIRPLKKIQNRDAHIAKAKEARQKFIDFCGGVGSYVYLQCGKYDKYGRVLVRVSNRRYSTKSINDLMLESGLANVYDGGTKKEFT